MKSRALVKKLDDRYEITEHYDVRARRNGLIIGSVRYSFFDGSLYRFAIDLHNGMPAYGSAPLEFAPFDLRYGEAPWSLPTVRPTPPAGEPTALDELPPPLKALPAPERDPA